jgi:hypothetical protein
MIHWLNVIFIVSLMSLHTRVQSDMVKIRLYFSVKQRLDALRSTLVHENTKTQLGQHVINCKFEQRHKHNARLFEKWAKDEDFPEDFRKKQA